MKALPAKVTIGQKYNPAMEISDQMEADAYFALCVDHSMTYHRMTRAEAEALERTNLGYWAGYYSAETRARVERLFRCSHPIFGSIESNGQPTPEAAFEAGREMAPSGRYTMAYRYTECGLDDVFIDGLDILKDDADEEVVCIPNINGLHKAISEAILSRKTSMSGRELRFLRTEAGMTQAEMAGIVHREPLAISRWERGESPIDANAEAIIRLLLSEKLGIHNDMTVADTSRSCVPSAVHSPISIDGSDPQNYRPAA